MYDINDKKAYEVGDEVKLYECGKNAVKTQTNLKSQQKKDAYEERIAQEAELQMRQMKVVAKNFVKKSKEMGATKAIASMMVGGAAVRHAAPLAEGLTNAINASDGFMEVMGTVALGYETAVMVAGGIAVAAGATYIACKAKELAHDNDLSGKFNHAYNNAKERLEPLKDSPIVQKMKKFATVAKGKMKTLNARSKMKSDNQKSEGTKPSRIQMMSQTQHKLAQYKGRQKA